MVRRFRCHPETMRKPEEIQNRTLAASLSAAPLSLARRSDFCLLVEMAILHSGGIPLIEGVPGWRFPKLLDRVKERGNVD